MNVVHIILGKANPERMNGVSRAVAQLAENQARQGIYVTIWGITPHPEHNYPARNFETFLFHQSRIPFLVPRSLINAIAALSADTVVHVHGGFISYFYTISYLLKFYGIPFVFTPHGSYNVIAMKKSAWRKKLYGYLFERSLLERASIVHLLGISEKNGLDLFLPGKQVAVIPNGIIPIKTIAKTISSNILLEDDIRNQHINFSFCGRIDIHTKGLDLLMAGFEAFAVDYPNATLTIIGDSGEMPKLIALQHKMINGSKVNIVGAKFGDEKLELIAASDAFFHPSRNEGIPTAVLESAMLEVPCIVSEATNVAQEILDYNAGIILNPNNAASITEAMHAVAIWKATGLQPMMKRNANTMAHEAFCWTKIVKQLKEVYATALRA